MENWLLMQTFYHGLTNSTRETMDAVTRRAFLSLTIAQATALVERDGIQPRLERRENSNPQERWRYALVEGGRHVVCQDGSTYEEAR
jgi:hypothetical protein